MKVPHSASTVLIVITALVAGLLSVGLTVTSIIQGDKRVNDVTTARKAELDRLSKDRDTQRRINAEQGLLIDELLTADSPQAKAAAVASSRRRQEEAGLTPRPTTTTTSRPSATSTTTTTTPPSTTTSTSRPPTTAPPPSTTTTTRLCVANVCV